MKRFALFPLVSSSLLIVSCSDFNGPLGSDFDPLMTPGSQQSETVSPMGNYNFAAGSFVTAASNSTAFFSKKPTGNADADELLAAGTSMRVVKSEGSFVKVELDNGKVGYVAAALLVEGQQGSALPLPYNGESAVPLPTGPIQDNLSPSAAPTDLGSGAPLPPIAPPTVQELPPSSTDVKKPEATLPQPLPLPEPVKPGGQ